LLFAFLFIDFLVRSNKRPSLFIVVVTAVDRWSLLLPVIVGVVAFKASLPCRRLVISLGYC